jgi:hypothetical protein
MRWRGLISLSAVASALVLTAAADASHLQVQIALFDMRVLPAGQSLDPGIFAEHVAHQALDPVSAAADQFSFVSHTARREILVTWGLTCTPQGPPDVDHISYDFRVALREAGSEAKPPGLATTDILTTSASGSARLTAPAGSVVWTSRRAHCGGTGVGPASGGIHGSNTLSDHGPVLAIPPFVPLPVLLTPVRHAARSTKGGYRLVAANAIPRNTPIYAVPAVAADLSGGRSLHIVFDGAGVHEERTVTAAKRLVIVFRARQPGVIRVSAELLPANASSNVVLLRVR